MDRWQVDQCPCFPAFLLMLGDYACEDATANVELCREAHEPGACNGYKIIQNLVCHCLMKRAFVAVRPDIQLQAFQFDAFAICYVIEIQGCEIGLAGFGAQASEFRDLHANQEIPAGVRVWKSLQHFIYCAWHLSVNCLSAKIPASEYRDIRYKPLVCHVFESL